jgi:hypothetical protein
MPASSFSPAGWPPVPVPRPPPSRGILTNPNFQVVIHALQQRQGYESLAEPEVTTTSGRQTQMRATTIQTIITSYNFQQGASASTGNTGNNAVP